MYTPVTINIHRHACIFTFSCNKKVCIKLYWYTMQTCEHEKPEQRSWKPKGHTNALHIQATRDFFWCQIDKKRIGTTMSVFGFCL